jgi:PQQ-dependent dehydrogenase (methanol/ethanol family)
MKDDDMRRYLHTSAVLALCLAIGIRAGMAVAQPAGGGIIPAEFGQNCSVCHGGGAEGSDRAPPLIENRRLRAQSEADIAAVIKNGRGNMPSFAALPPEQQQRLAHFVHSLNAAAYDAKPEGDAAAGSKLFTGSGRCMECHMVNGRGSVNGPDLSGIAHQATVAELRQSLVSPAAKISSGYSLADVSMRDGTVLHGFLRSRTAHSVVLQTADGQLHPLLDAEYGKAADLRGSSMPKYGGSEADVRDLVAYLSTLGGVQAGADAASHDKISAAAVHAVESPAGGNWTTYSGNLSGNRHATLQGIDVANVGGLQTAWVHPLPYAPLETTPLVIDGIMYVTAPNQVFALDARTGSEIWNYSRPRSTAAGISGDAARGANRGVAALGDRIFFITDDAHLISLHRVTGALMWEVALPGRPGKFGGTSAPLVVGDLVIAGISGGDEAVRGFVAAYKAVSGEQAWRFWTVPKPGEPGSETWGGAEPQGGASWTTPSYDITSGVLYLGTGNPYPDTDGDHRAGDDLYTDSDLALDAKTGKLLWHFQFTPHDLHDWDANQPIALVDARFRGKDRKLLLHANRNGFFYVLDRTDGKMLQATPFINKLTWASGVGADGRPQLLPNNETTGAGVETCPAVRGATNWYSTAFSPATQLYYVMAVEDCTLYRKAHDGGYGRVDHPDDPPVKVLRALAVDGGKVAWELPMNGSPEANYSGVLSTGGGVLFFGGSTGEISAVDAKTGAYLWHFDANQPIKGSPMTYEVMGRQYVAIAAGSNILSFALAGH